MGKLEIQITQTGDVQITTSTGAEFRLSDRDGHLEVRVLDGLLAVHPKSSNVLDVVAQDWSGRELGAPTPEEAWAEGCRKGLATNPGWDEQALDANPYVGGKQ